MSARVSPRAAVVGAGLMGRWHAHALRRLGVPVAAVVDPDLDRGERLVAAHPGATIFHDIRSLLSRADVHVVHICTPLETHGALVRAALDAGVHVIVEKPLAATAEETDQLFQRAKLRGVLLCPVHQMPFQNGVIRLQRRLEELGSLLHVEATLCTAGGMGRSERERFQIAADILPHPLSLQARLLPVPLGALEWQAQQPRLGELRLHGHTRGVSASILVSMHGRPTVNSLRLIGDRATAHVDLFHGFTVFEPGTVSRARKIWRPFSMSGGVLVAAARNLAHRAIRGDWAYPGLAEFIRRFYLAVDGSGEPPIGEDEARSIAIVRDRLLFQFSSSPVVGLESARRRSKDSSEPDMSAVTSGTRAE